MKPPSIRLVHTKLRGRFKAVMKGCSNRCTCWGRKRRKKLPQKTPSARLTSGPARAMRRSRRGSGLRSALWSRTVMPPMGRRLMARTGTPLETAVTAWPTSCRITEPKRNNMRTRARIAIRSPLACTSPNQSRKRKSGRVKCTRTSMPRMRPAGMDHPIMTGLSTFGE